MDSDNEGFDIGLQQIDTTVDNRMIVLDVRGTIIKIPRTVAFKSEVIRNYYDNVEPGNKKEICYLNFNPDIMQKLFDYLTGMRASSKNYLEEVMELAEKLKFYIPENEKIKKDYNKKLRSTRYRYCF